MHLLRFRQTALAGNQPLHEFEIPGVESERTVYPNFYDIHQFGEIDLLHPPAGCGDSIESIAHAGALLDERCDLGFAPLLARTGRFRLERLA